MLHTYLRKWGHEALFAEDGAHALRLLTAMPFDVAILDWMMPGLSGTDVCRAIRTQGAARPPYLLLLTARTQVEDIVAGLDAGADEYMIKPYHPAELAARLRAAQRLLKVQDDLIVARKVIAYQSLRDVTGSAFEMPAFLG